MSNLSDKVLADLVVALPYYKVWKEHYVQYKGSKLFFDFYLPELLVAVEVQGIQHDKFVRHFHGDASGYKASKRRDSLKKEWAAGVGVRLVEVRESDLPLSPKDVFDIIDGDLDND